MMMNCTWLNGPDDERWEAGICLYSARWILTEGISPYRLGNANLCTPVTVVGQLDRKKGQAEM